MSVVYQCIGGWPLIIPRLSVTTVNFSQSCLQPNLLLPCCRAVLCVVICSQILSLSTDFKSVNSSKSTKNQNRNQIKTSFRTPLLFSNVSFSSFSSPRAPRPPHPTSRCRGPTCRPSAPRSRPPCPLPFPRGCHPQASLWPPRPGPDYTPASLPASPRSQPLRVTPAQGLSFPASTPPTWPLSVLAILDWEEAWWASGRPCLVFPPPTPLVNRIHTLPYPWRTFTVLW